MGKIIVCIGDTHFPFQCNSTLDKIYSVIKSISKECVSKSKELTIVQMGDLYDFYSASRFPRSHNLMTPIHEFEEARASAAAMWDYIARIAPGSTKYQLWGNHDVRPKKRILELLPSLEHLFNIEESMRFPGVETLCSDKHDLVIDDIVFEHGYGKPGAHMRNNRACTVVGHSHKGGVTFEQLRVKGKTELLWELNCGYVGNPSLGAFDYARKTWVPWTKGYGLIDEKGPRFCPL